MYVIANVVMISCTNDEVETTPNNNTVKVFADEPGDGTIIPPPITPPKP
ncbi:MAG: hypothetical protein JHC39_05345 [Lentimicrobium sp.]|nr:hypothetical protein [Lentimicrobium sp.]